MKSTEKITAFKEALLRTDDEFDGILGMVQGVVGTDVAFGNDTIGKEIVGLGDDTLDQELLNIAGFVLWLRSDDAAPVDAQELVTLMPANIGDLIAAADIA
jgi:hypothetical protein